MKEGLTIVEAGALLGVSPQRVHQLLRLGVLLGPDMPKGQRAPRGVARVWRRSAEEYAASRRRRVVHDPASSLLHDDVVRLKIALDAARDAIARERQQSRRLARLLADAVETLREEQRLSDAAEVITEQYATIITTHMMPDRPPKSDPTFGET